MDDINTREYLGEETRTDRIYWSENSRGYLLPEQPKITQETSGKRDISSKLKRG